MNTLLPAADEVARVIGKARGFVNASAVAARCGISVEIVRQLPGARPGVGGAVMVPRLVVLLAEAFGFPAVGSILRAGLVSTVPSEFGERPLPTAEEIARVAGSSRSVLKHREFAKRLGAPTARVRAQFERGGLPGARRVSAGVVMVPRRLLRLAQAYGLPQVERMAGAGLL
jgi:hypothetical protein